MDRFDDMRAKVAINQEESGGSTGGGGSSGENAGGNIYLGGTTITIEPTESLLKGDRFVGVKNANANLQMSSAGIGATNMAVVSEDLSVGIIATTLSMEATSLELGFFTEDYYYELVEVPIPSGILLNSAIISSSTTSINEDGTLIVVRDLYDAEGILGRVLIIDVDKENKSATCYYQDDFGVANSYTVASSYEIHGFTKKANVGIRITKDYLFYTFWVDAEYSTTSSTSTSTRSYTTTGVYKYNGGSFITEPLFSAFCGDNNIITNVDQGDFQGYVCKANGWVDENTLVFIHAANGKTSSQYDSAVPYIHKLVVDGSRLVSHTSTDTMLLRSSYKYAASYSMSKNGRYIGAAVKTGSDWNDRDGLMYEFNPLDMTVTQIGNDVGYTSGATPYVDSNGEYCILGAAIYKTSDTSSSTTPPYSVSASISSRHFDIGGGTFFRAGNYKCFLSPTSDAEYIVSPYDGNTILAGNIYGIVNENLHAGEKGTGQLLFASETVTTGTSDVEGVVSPPRFINHIESTGTQYIKTGVTVNQDTKIVMDVMFNSATGNEALWCSRASGSTNTFTCFKIANQFRTDYYNTQNTISTLTIEPYKKYQVCQNSNMFYIDGVLQHESDVTYFESPYNMILFASHQNGETSGLSNYGKYKLYGCKIYNGGTLVRDFRPAIYNKQYCLYDVVESKPYYNAGTGVFMGDGTFKEMVEYDIPEIDRTPTFINYIQSSGTQYIDTGVNGTAKGTYEIKFSMLGSQRVNYEQYFAGDQTAKTAKIFQDSGNGYVKAEQGSNFWKLFDNDANAHTIKVSADGVYADDVRIGDYTPDAWGTLTFYIFNAHAQSSLTSTMQLYHLKMYSDGVLVRDFKPAIVRNQYCLYDMVESKPYFNAGTGTFTGA